MLCRGLAQQAELSNKANDFIHLFLVIYLCLQIQALCNS